MMLDVSFPPTYVVMCRAVVVSLALLFGGLGSIEKVAAASRGPILSPGTSALDFQRTGDRLLGELNCTACHRADSPVSERLFSKEPPRLTEVRGRIGPKYLQEFLSNPHQVKPGTTMPDLLHGLQAGEKQEAVGALAQFLWSLGTTNLPASPVPTATQIEQGRELYHSVGCVACHAPQQSVEGVEKGGYSVLQTTSVPLGDLARKTTVEDLAVFLRDPLAVRPSGRMPSLNLNANEAQAIAAYLLRDQSVPDRPGVKKRQKGLAYEYFEAPSFESMDFSRLTPVETGSIEHFLLTPRKRDENIGLRFVGSIKVSVETNYIFSVTSSGGVRLWIDDRMVADKDPGSAAGEAEGKMYLKAGDHKIVIHYVNGQEEPALAVFWQQTGRSKGGISGNALSHLAAPWGPPGPGELRLDEGKVKRGRALFGTLGCAACHDVSLGEGRKGLALLTAPPFEALRPGTRGGCLDRPGKGVPQYALTDAQRRTLRATLSDREQLLKPSTLAEQITAKLAAFNCYACHARDGVGGPQGPRRAYFTTRDQEVDLGDEGRFPPLLTKVGNKLRREWIRTVLTGKGAMRPYMATRMPRFGLTNVHSLVEGFEKLDVPEAGGESGTAIRYTDAKHGRQLVGVHGLACVACHNFNGKRSLGIPAMDLGQTTERLKKDWFIRYLKDPASLRPGTRMPAFWPGGQAANPTILEGDVSRQIEAIWAYLSEGRRARLPEGMLRIGIELVADKEPVIYRGFIEGGGSRPIGVGYPEKANLAFDATEMRLSLIWQGRFMDASLHRRSRGSGWEPPLGDNVVRLTEGAPFAFLEAADTPWPKESGKTAGYRMRGYRLDQQRRPTFLYSYQGMDIFDFPEATMRGSEPVLRRTLEFKSERPIRELWFRAAVGENIEQKENGYWVDGRMTVRFELPGGGQPVVRKSQGKSELLVPVQGDGAQARIVEEIVW